MSNRPHAHSKRRSSGPPRTFSASTGLTGATEAELAHRAAITEAAMAAAEKSARKAARSPRFTPPRGSRGPAARSPRVFSLPAEPVPSHPEVAEAGSVASPPRPPEQDKQDKQADRPRSRPPMVAPPRSPSKPEGPTAPRRSTRTLVSKLGAAVSASEAMAGKAIRAARSDGAVAPVAPVEAPRADFELSSAKPTEATASAPSPGPKASRAPKGGARWRRRHGKATSAGEAARRPTDKSRPASTPPSQKESRRLALPLAGHRHKPDPDAKPTVNKARAAVGKTAAGTTDRKLFSRAAAATKLAPQKKKKKKPAEQKTPATPEQRRRRIPVAVAGVFAVAVLTTSFPLSSLLSQHRELSAAAAQLAEVQKVNRVLIQQQHALDSNVAVTRLARGNYQMVSPGQTLYDVLPPSSTTGKRGTTGTTGKSGKSGSTDTTTPGSAVNGDPGNQPLVAPANAPDLNPQVALSQPIPVSAPGSSTPVPTAKGATSASASSSGASAPPSEPTTFWGRVSNTLQFWR